MVISDPGLPNNKIIAEQAIGLYEQQDPNQRDLNLRGQFVTDEDGKYSLYCLRPTPYPVSTLHLAAPLNKFLIPCRSPVTVPQDTSSK